LPGWEPETFSAAAWQALLIGCGVLRADPVWTAVCDAALALPAQPDADQRMTFLRTRFQPWQAVGADGQIEGLATGYYEPVLHGSRLRSERFPHPLYARPDDLLSVELDTLIPELRGRRVRARLEGNRVLPYYRRDEIEHQVPASLRGREIVWIDDAVEVFFLHIQGSGRVELEEGGGLHVGYADQNGQPFRSVARLLIDSGELTVAQATLQGMKAWARAHPERVDAFLDANASYVFFKELSGDLPGPIGTLGVPLLGEASVAVDARIVPLGAPVLIDTTFPLSQQPLRRVAMAQDTGGAINGAVRIDYFWGLGDDALAQAGRMRQKLRLWALLPLGTHPDGGAVVPDVVQLPGAALPH
jgi:membrane-bound lytic murein transglycosylase A